MRGVEISCDGLVSYVRLEERIPLDHPLRAIRSLVDEVLDQMLIAKYCLNGASTKFGGMRPASPTLRIF